MQQIKFKDTLLRKNDNFIQTTHKPSILSITRNKSIEKSVSSQQKNRNITNKKTSTIMNLITKKHLQTNRKKYMISIQDKTTNNPILIQSVTKSKNIMNGVQATKKNQYFGSILQFANRLAEDTINYPTNCLRGTKETYKNLIDFSPPIQIKKQSAPTIHKKALQISDELNNSTKTIIETQRIMPLKHSLSQQKQPQNPINRKKYYKTIRQLPKTNRIQYDRKTQQQNYHQIQQQQRKIKLNIRKQLQLEYLKPFNPPSNITASQYIIFQPIFSQHKIDKKLKIYNMTNNIRLLKQIKQYKNYNKVKQKQQLRYPHSNKVIASQNSKNMVEIASLTKIMTCILAIQISEQYQIDMSIEKALIGKFQAKIQGTSAELQQGQVYTVLDLLYGLMLPSGNDASLAIAVFFGRILLDQQLTTKKHKKVQSYNRFIVQMNNKAKKLGMQKTTYANSHGLSNYQNRSCAYDVAILCEYAMQNNKFKQIVKTKIYESVAYQHTKQPRTKKQMKKNQCINEEKDNQMFQQENYLFCTQDNQENQKLEIQYTKTRDIIWENTHKLLHSCQNQYIGIKTGITPMAGPCLASCVKLFENRYFIIVVLNCDKMASRFRDTQTLKKWIIDKQQNKQKRNSQKVCFN